MPVYETRDRLAYVFKCNKCTPALVSDRYNTKPEAKNAEKEHVKRKHK